MVTISALSVSPSPGWWAHPLDAVGKAASASAHSLPTKSGQANPIRETPLHTLTAASSQWQTERYKRLTSLPRGKTNHVVEFLLQCFLWGQTDADFQLRTCPYFSFILLPLSASLTSLLLWEIFQWKIPTSGSAFREFYLRWYQSQPWEIDSKNFGGVSVTDRMAMRISPVGRWGIDSLWLATAGQWLRIALLVSRGI